MSDVEAVMEALEASLKKGEIGSKGLTAINVKLEDGRYHPISNTACQAGLRYLTNLDSIPILSASKTQRLGESGDEYKAICVEFCDWLVNQSPYAPAFASKDPLYCVEKGVVTQTNVNANLMVAAQVVHRYLWEWPKVVKEWKKFSEIYGKDFSFLLAHTFNHNKDKVESAHMGGHMAISSNNICEDYILSFRDRKISNSYNTGTFAEKKCYTGFTCIWGLDSGNGGWLKELKDYVKNKGIVTQEAAKNPFREVYEKQKKQNYNYEGVVFKDEEFYTILKEMHNIKYGEWVNA